MNGNVKISNYVIIFYNSYCKIMSYYNKRLCYFMKLNIRKMIIISLSLFNLFFYFNQINYNCDIKVYNEDIIYKEMKY